MKKIALLLSLFGLLLQCGVHRRSVPLNVVLISMDTLRADHLGCYGYSRNTSPNIDRLAAESIVFSNAFSTAPKTAESHMSMFTSLYPSVHQVYTIVDGTTGKFDQRIVTLAQILKENGYRTVGFHDGGHVGGELGFSRGFQSYEFHKGNQELAEKWIRENGSKEKFFLFYHTYQVHDPYTPNPPYDKLFARDYKGKMICRKNQFLPGQKWEDFVSYYWSLVDSKKPEDIEYLISLYDAEIAEMDAKLARLFKVIDEFTERTVVILLSDHGEEFYEHGQFTHNQLYNEILRVPLIIRLPENRQGIRIDRNVSLIDLAPTILAMTSIPPIPQFQGQSLLDQFEPISRQKAVFSEWPRVNMQSLISKRRKVISHHGRRQYYDLLKDQGERRNLNLAQPKGAMRAIRKEYFTRLEKRLDLQIYRNQEYSENYSGGRSRQKVSPETLEELKALGYIQ